MTRTSTFRAVTMAAIIAVWLLPLVRACRLFSYTAAAFADSGSIHDWNDYAFSRCLLLSYSLSFLVGITLVWLLFHTRVWLLALPLSGSFLIAGVVLRLRPESVIVFFSGIHPFLPAAFSVIAALTACLILWGHKNTKREVRIPHNVV